jgi:hypothetical protein
MSVTSSWISDVDGGAGIASQLHGGVWQQARPPPYHIIVHASPTCRWVVRVPAPRRATQLKPGELRPGRCFAPPLRPWRSRARPTAGSTRSAIPPCAAADPIVNFVAAAHPRQSIFKQSSVNQAMHPARRLSGPCTQTALRSRVVVGAPPVNTATYRGAVGVQNAGIGCYTATTATQQLHSRVVVGAPPGHVAAGVLRPVLRAHPGEPRKVN